MNNEPAVVLQAIFRAVFKLPAGTDVTGYDQTNTPAWDSLAHVALVTGIESEFEISLEVDDQLQMTSFEAICRMIEQRVG